MFAGGDVAGWAIGVGARGGASGEANGPVRAAVGGWDAFDAGAGAELDEAGTEVTPVFGHS